MNQNLAHPISFAKPRVLLPQGQEVKAIVIVLHGLNLKPERMDDWAQVFLARGALVIRLALFGHGGDEADMRAASAEIWRKQMDEALALAQSESSKHNAAPIYFLGFSLGALVGLEAQARSPEPGILQRMVLIAPAISVPWYAKVAVSLGSLLGKGFLVPARNPKSYRVNRGTSVGAYQALLELKKSLEDLHYKNADVKTLVLLDTYDELISSNAVKNIVKKNRLGLWEITLVNNRAARDTYGFRHLLVDRESVGARLWQEMSDKVIRRFDL
ncbi:MAG: alpha/beta hydrolase [Minisyncoccia bacterium]